MDVEQGREPRGRRMVLAFVGGMMFARAFLTPTSWQVWLALVLHGVAASLMVLNLAWTGVAVVALLLCTRLFGLPAGSVGFFSAVWAAGVLSRRGWRMCLAAVAVALVGGSQVIAGGTVLDRSVVVLVTVAAGLALRGVKWRDLLQVARVADLELELEQLRSKERLKLADELHQALTGRLEQVRQVLASRPGAVTVAQRRRLLDLVDAEVRAALVDMRGVMHLLVDEDAERADELVSADMARPLPAPGDEPRDGWRRMAALLPGRLGDAPADAGIPPSWAPGGPRTGSVAVAPRGPLRGLVSWAVLVQGLVTLIALRPVVGNWRSPTTVDAVLVVALVLWPRVALMPAVVWHALLLLGVPGEAVLGPLVVTFFAFRSGRTWWVWPVAGLEAGVEMAQALRHGTLVQAGEMLALCALAGAVGMLVRYFGERATRAARREAALAEERQRLLAEARSDLARELHDVVAHQLSVAALQVMGHRHSSDPGELDVVLDRVEAATRQAQVELAHLGRVVTSGEPVTGVLAPSVVLARVRDELVASGRRVEIRQDDDLDGFPVGVRRTVVRLLQESTTNVLRYAPPRAVVRITVVARDDEVEVDVWNSGDGWPVPASPLAGGLGLRGLADRVDLSGGTFRAGHRGDGSWLVHATLPTA